MKPATKRATIDPSSTGILETHNVHPTNERINSVAPTALPQLSRRLVNFKHLTEIGINFSREHLWRLEAAGQFPRRIYLSPQKLAWFEDEIVDWIEQRSAERVNRTYRTHD